MHNRKIINVGVLGCASIAERFVIPAFNELDKFFKLEGVASRSEEKAISFAKKFNCKPFKSYEELKEYYSNYSKSKYYTVKVK